MSILGSNKSPLIRLTVLAVVSVFAFISLFSLQMESAHAAPTGCSSASWALVDAHHPTPLLCNMTVTQHLNWWSQTFTGLTEVLSITALAALILLGLLAQLARCRPATSAGRRRLAVNHGPPGSNPFHPLASFWSKGLAQLRV